MSDLLFLLHGMMMALVWFLGVNAVATLFVVAVERLTRNDCRRTPQFWLGLRLLPAAASIGLVAAVFVPSYWKHEPRNYSEGFDVTLATVALVAFVVGVSGIARGAAAWVRVSHRAKAWRQGARPLSVAGTSTQAFEIEGDAPIVALVGILRPRLFITRRVVAALTDEELAASVAHELGHRRALDNLKRLAMRTAPDFLATTSVGGALERRWASAAEQVADRRACETVTLADRGRARCALASAIVKVARMMPPMSPAAEPICTLVDGGDIASRVRSLLDDGAPAATTPRAHGYAIGAVLAAAALAFAFAPLLRVVHVATEVLVHTLP